MYKRMTKEEKKIGRKYYRRLCFWNAVVSGAVTAVFTIAVKKNDI